MVISREDFNQLQNHVQYPPPAFFRPLSEECEFLLYEKLRFHLDKEDVLYYSHIWKDAPEENE